VEKAFGSGTTSQSRKGADFLDSLGADIDRLLGGRTGANLLDKKAIARTEN